MRKTGKYISIIDCKKCQELPEYIKAVDEQVRNLSRHVFKMNKVWEKETSIPYGVEDETLIKCQFCGTYYWRTGYYNEEDSFISGTTTVYTIQRLSFLQTIKILQKKRLKPELKLLKDLIKFLINNAIELISSRNKEIHRNVAYNFTINILDHHTDKKNWDKISNLLLKHSDFQIVSSAVKYILAKQQKYKVDLSVTVPFLVAMYDNKDDEIRNEAFELTIDILKNQKELAGIILNEIESSEIAVTRKVRGIITRCKNLLLKGI